MGRQTDRPARKFTVAYQAVLVNYDPIFTVRFPHKLPLGDGTFAKHANRHLQERRWEMGDGRWAMGGALVIDNNKSEYLFVHFRKLGMQVTRVSCD